MFKIENFYDNKIEYKYQNKEKKEMGSVNIIQIRLREIEGGGGGGWLKNGDGLFMIWIIDLEYVGFVWSFLGIQEVVFVSVDELFVVVGEFEGEDIVFVEVELVFVRFIVVEYFYIIVFYFEKKL